MSTSYLTWGTLSVSPENHREADQAYEKGALYTRIEKNLMTLTRSVRIRLSKFNLSSENRRILKKNTGITLTVVPLPHAEYSWEIGKLGKDFYETKFGPDIFSANAIKKLCTEPHNFNTLFVYKDSQGNVVGYCIAYMTPSIIHYSYPFYDLAYTQNSLGLGMMLLALQYAQETGRSYIYLGSLQRPNDTYKLQFEGLEWFDEHSHTWSTNIDSAKAHLNSAILQ